MISKTKISERTKKKRNPEIIETINIAKKNGLLELAKRISASKSQYTNLNLDQLSNLKGNKIMVVGNVLGYGEINKKINISAIKFSKQAIQKLEKANCKISNIREEIVKNNKLKDVEIIW